KSLENIQAQLNTQIQLNTSNENSESFKNLQIESDINIENNSLENMEITLDKDIEISNIENYQYQNNYDYENNQYDDKYDNENYQCDNKNYQYDYKNYQYDYENYQYDFEYDNQSKKNATNFINEMLITEHEFSEDFLDKNEIYNQINWDSNYLSPEIIQALQLLYLKIKNSAISNNFYENVLKIFKCSNATFTVEFIEDTRYQICSESQYDNKETPRKFAIYFPLIP
ncbi:5151_t:CDS:2, partial [Gigaspora margarita]